MKETLKPGLTHHFAFEIPASKTVPKFFPEAGEFSDMPPVFATGMMVALMEWTCVKLLAPHLDKGEGSLGVHIDVSHQAATPPGMTVRVDAECVGLNGRRASFQVRAHDGVDVIGQGRHERFIVSWERFNARLADKIERAMV